MGEIAEMMLDGTMDYETGEWNFDGADGPGFPMTAREATAFRRGRAPGPPAYTVSKKLRARIEAFGDLRQCNEYHWQVRKDGRVVADWWPHRSKYRLDGKTRRGNEGDFVRALAKRGATQ